MISDQEARESIKSGFYKAYREHGLYVIVMSDEIVATLDLDEQQARRCLDYLGAKGLIKRMTLDGGYSPTVALVDEVEKGVGT